ncbi:MAG TPA: dienelactone hydrolase, partial [Rhizobacter sp.]|nr:dienelactone hydrolase [Rhizobacter sp.]
NDMYFGPDYPQEWFKAYRAHGAPARMVQFPPHGEDGHALFTRFPEVWKPEVESFLREQGFKWELHP